MSETSCENCGRAIGKLEPAHVWRDSIVCSQCRERLSPTLAYASPVAELDEPLNALGITGRPMAWFVAAVGLIFSPVLIGIPIFLWGCLAEHRMTTELKRRKKLKKLAAG